MSGAGDGVVCPARCPPRSAALAGVLGRDAVPAKDWGQIGDSLAVFRPGQGFKAVRRFSALWAERQGVARKQARGEGCGRPGSGWENAVPLDRYVTALKHVVPTSVFSPQVR